MINNYIIGNKKNNINIIYTPASNLKKDGSMDVGQVSFKSNKLVKKIHVESRKNEIINRLNKSRIEEYPDFSVLLSKRDKELRRRERLQKEHQERYKQQRIDEKRKEKQRNGNAYDSLMKEENMYSNKGIDTSRTAADLEEDFMWRRF